MKRTVFERAVLHRREALGVVDGYFYLKPVALIAGGFTLETILGGRVARVSRFHLPLYDRRRGFSLLFSEVLLRDGKVFEIVGLRENEIAGLFIELINPEMDILIERCDLRGFAKWVKDLDLENPLARRTYASSLIMLGEFDAAKRELGLVLQHPREMPHLFQEETLLLSRSLAVSGDHAQSLLMRWLAETKHDLRLD